MKKRKLIKFNGKTILSATIVNNIVSVFDMAGEDERNDWYGEAKKWATDFLSANIGIYSGHDLNRFVGVVAALSPLKAWEQNKALAEKLFAMKGLDSGHTEVFIKKANKIYDSAGNEEYILSVLNGDKIKSFYLNIRHPEKVGSVTIDRHALSVSLHRWLKTDKERRVTALQYKFFKECYIEAAAKMNVTPQHLQGVTWSSFRANKKLFIK